MFWKKKEIEKPKRKYTRKKQEEEKTITVTFYADDDCFVRARKLFQIMNLSDRLGLADTMARGISLYMKADKMKYEAKNKSKAKPKKKKE